MIDSAQLRCQLDVFEFQETSQGIVPTNIVLLPVKVLFDGRELEPVHHLRLGRNLNLIDHLRFAGPPEERCQQLRQRRHVALFQRRLQAVDKRTPITICFNVQEGK